MTRRELLVRAGMLAGGLSAAEILGGSTLARAGVDSNPTGGIMRMGGPAINIRNFNPFAATPMTSTTVGMFEPLLIYNYAIKKIVPWLATSYAWSNDNSKLTLTARDGVKWSDGQPFTAKDIAFTFNLMKQNPGLLGSASTSWSYLSSVTAQGNKAVFSFKDVYSPGLFDIMHQLIVPEHQWSSAGDPVKFTNPHPVATGPLTKIESFNAEDMLLLRNPNYWIQGRPYIKGQRFTAEAGNEQRLQALITNQLDWGGGYIPNIDSVYVDKDKKHHGFWWPLNGMVDLVVNHTRPPFDQLPFRQALSLAMDREQMLTIALQGHSKVADMSNLPVFSQSNWIDKKVTSQYDWLMKRNVNRANQMLDKAGFTKGSDGIRTMPGGKRLAFQLTVPTGWTDFISDCDVIANNLKDVGIQATIFTPSVDTWYNNVYSGNYDMALGDPGGFGATPFENYRGYLSSQTYVPIGQQANENWQRYKNADADSLLSKWAQTSDVSEQHSLCSQLTKIFAENIPIIPLYYEPEWGAYNTLYFTGFPHPPNPYAPLSDVAPFPVEYIVLSHLKPVANPSS